jgi:hypothetical protein
MAKLKLELNSIQSLKDLLQECYNNANEQIVQVQNEINKLANATQLSEEPIDAKSKYAKAINDYLSIKDKAISKKIDVGKILADVCNHNGDVASALNDSKAVMDFDFDDIKQMVDNSLQEKTNKIELTRK